MAAADGTETGSARSTVRVGRRNGSPVRVLSACDAASEGTYHSHFSHSTSGSRRCCQTGSRGGYSRRRDDPASRLRRSLVRCVNQISSTARAPTAAHRLPAPARPMRARGARGSRQLQPATLSLGLWAYARLATSARDAVRPTRRSTRSPALGSCRSRSTSTRPAAAPRHTPRA